MNVQNIQHFIVAFVVFALAAAGASRANALSTAFTYQGQLEHNGSPVGAQTSASCNFQFTLWDQPGSGSPPTGGNSQGCVVEPGVGVSGGLFTVSLDFGGTFNGGDRWLQIAVCCGVSCSSASCAGLGADYATLPRQQLTATPYALYASNTFGGSNVVLGVGASPGSGNNTVVGVSAFAAGLGNNNTVVGSTALALGVWAFAPNNNNTAVGARALEDLGYTSGNDPNNLLPGGQYNIALGYTAGLSFFGAESYNIDIGNLGVLGESNTIRIGTPGQIVSGQQIGQTSAYIAGVAGATSSSGTVVYVNGDGQLGTVTGSTNIALGDGTNTTGLYNTAVGLDALQANGNGQANVAVGWNALQACGGLASTAVGTHALKLHCSSSDTAVGYLALGSASGHTGSNVAVGREALSSLATGQSNVALGTGAGSFFNGAESDNIDIGNSGTAGDSGIIRIGTPGTQSAIYLAGIGAGVGNLVQVTSQGQLTFQMSSARFKENIRDMGDSTSALMKLRPVRFRYKKDIDPSGLEQYGLVAEQVATVYPDLVAYDDQGRPLTVRYQSLAPMLLNEVQKQTRQLNDQAHQIAVLQKQVEQLVALQAESAALKASRVVPDCTETQRAGDHGPDGIHTTAAAF